MKKIIIGLLLYLIIAVMLIGCAQQLMSDEEILDKANEILNEESDEMQNTFDLGIAYLEKEMFLEAIIEFDSINKSSDLFSDSQIKIQDAKIKIFDEVDTLSVQGDFEEAIDKLGKLIVATGEDIDTSVKITEIENTCRENYVQEAQTVFVIDGYEAAISVLTDGLVILEGDVDLLEAVDEYRTYAPVWLTDVEWLLIDAYGYGRDYGVNEFFEDKFGNSYSTSIYLARGYVEYYIDNKYSTIQGTIACQKDQEFFTSSNMSCYAYVNIYGDDNLLFKSDDMFLDSEPQQFSVDISLYKNIKIEWVAEGGINVGHDWGDSATLFDTAFFR